MKATKKQIAEVTEAANKMNFSVEKALITLSHCSASTYKCIGSIGVVESSIRANSEHFVDTARLAKVANRLGVSVGSLMTDEQKKANWCV